MSDDGENVYANMWRTATTPIWQGNSQHDGALTMEHLRGMLDMLTNDPVGVYNGLSRTYRRAWPPRLDLPRGA